MGSMKQNMAADDEDEESEQEESPIPFEVRTDHDVTDKPEPSPASLYRYATKGCILQGVESKHMSK